MNKSKELFCFNQKHQLLLHRYHSLSLHHNKISLQTFLFFINRWVAAFTFIVRYFSSSSRDEVLFDDKEDAETKEEQNELVAIVPKKQA